MSSSILASRTTSSFPLSIGTGIAMSAVFSERERAYDPKTKPPDRINLSDYTDMYVNIETLFRNMFGSIDTSEAERIKETIYADYIVTEIDVIKSLMQVEGQDVCNLVFYTSDHDKIIKKVSNTKLTIVREHTTTKQMIYNKLKIATLKILHKRLPEIEHFDDSFSIVPSNKKILLFSHNVLDLLSYGKFAKFTLLESHTGNTKNKLTFYTKYSSHSSATPLPPMPFILKLLVVFGDKEHIKAITKSARDQISDLAVKCSWTPLTTKEKISYDVDSNIKDLVLKQLIKLV